MPNAEDVLDVVSAAVEVLGKINPLIEIVNTCIDKYKGYQSFKEEAKKIRTLLHVVDGVFRDIKNEYKHGGLQGADVLREPLELIAQVVNEGTSFLKEYTDKRAFVIQVINNKSYLETFGRATANIHIAIDLVGASGVCVQGKNYAEIMREFDMVNRALTQPLLQPEDHFQRQPLPANIQNINGEIYKGMAVSCPMAADRFRQLADRGDARDQCNLGIMYARGQLVAKNDKTAVEWLRKAADQGYAKAQVYLGLMYSKDRGVAKDDKEAFQLYLKASEVNDADAQYNLGLMCLLGHGVDKNDKAAVERRRNLRVLKLLWVI
jgi:Sel1 repeat